MMTKKDYIAIARMISMRVADFTPGDMPITEAYNHGVKLVTKDLAEYMAQDNPDFDRTKFLEACGIK